jgi:hypothetical protein
MHFWSRTAKNKSLELFYNRNNNTFHANYRTSPSAAGSEPFTLYEISVASDLLGLLKDITELPDTYLDISYPPDNEELISMIQNLREEVSSSLGVPREYILFNEIGEELTDELDLEEVDIEEFDQRRARGFKTLSDRNTVFCFLVSNRDYGVAKRDGDATYLSKRSNYRNTGFSINNFDPDLAFDFDNGVVWTREPKFRDYSCEIEFMYKNDIYVAEILLLTAKDNTFECTRCNSPNSRFLGFDITEYDKEIVRHSSCLKCGKDNSTVYKA